MFLHCSNADVPTLLTVEGIVTDFNAKQYLNDWFPISVSPSFNVSVAIFWQLQNAPVPIFFTEAGIVTEVTSRFPLKASCPIS